MFYRVLPQTILMQDRVFPLRGETLYLGVPYLLDKQALITTTQYAF